MGGRVLCPMTPMTGRGLGRRPFPWSQPHSHTVTLMLGVRDTKTKGNSSKGHPNKRESKQRVSKQRGSKSRVARNLKLRGYPEIASSCKSGVPASVTMQFSLFLISEKLVALFPCSYFPFFIAGKEVAIFVYSYSSCYMSLPSCASPFLQLLQLPLDTCPIIFFS